MKKITLLLVISILCFSFPLLGITETNSCGENATWSIEDGVFTVEGSGDMINFEYSWDQPWEDNAEDITSIVVKDGITSIGDYAFYDFENVTTVTLPEGITSIGKSAFNSCENLTSITIPSTVTTIGEEAFYYCKSIVEITLPASVTEIGAGAFASMNELVSFNFSENVTRLEENTFLYNTNLKNFVLPQNLTYIGKKALSSLYALETLEIPASVTTIEETAFGSLAGITEITVNENSENYKSVDGILYTKDGTMLLAYPGASSNTSYTVLDNTTTIASNAFCNAENLTEIILPNTLTTINASAFEDCNNLLSITLPEGITTIAENTFSFCYNLNSITLPSTLTTIQQSVFTGCSELTSITLPVNVNYLESTAFKNTSGLKEIIVDEANTNFASVDGVLFTKDLKILTHYPVGKIEPNYDIPTGTEIIASYAFENAEHLFTVTFPETLTHISTDAFTYNVLTTITFPQSLQVIEEDAFCFSQNLIDVFIPENVISVGNNAFAFSDHLLTATVAGKNTILDEWGVFGYGSDDFTLSGLAGSTAEAYAKAEEIPFTVLENITSTTTSSKEWTCASCNTANTGKFCSECGAARVTEIKCTECGYVVPKGETPKFCPECGTKF